MKPETNWNLPYEPARFRMRRARDIRDLALAFAFAIVLNVVMLTAMATHPEWFSAQVETFARALRVLLAIGVYVASGGLLAALASHRMAVWRGIRPLSTPLVAWQVFLAWPLLIASLLLRLVHPIRVGA